MEKFYPIHSNKPDTFTLFNQEGDKEKEYQGKMYTYIGSREKQYTFFKRLRVGFMTLIKRIGALFNLCKYSPEDWRASVTGKRQIRVYLEKASTKKIDSPQRIEPQELTPSFERRVIKQKMSDAEIIENLERQGFMKPIERGSDGSCLLHSIAAQIEIQDMSEPLWRNWITLSPTEKANLLRKWAMEEESKFIQDIMNRSPKNWLFDDHIWIHELYKDIRQEFGAKTEQVRTEVKTMPIEQQVAYVKEHFSAYQLRTSQPNNWTGTSEMIALSHVFRRPVEMYGNDFASSKSVTLFDGVVEPYFSRAIGNGAPIRVFQCNGGGHYRELKLGSS